MLLPLVRKMFEPHWPHSYEVANSVGFFRELSWLTGHATGYL